MEVNKRFLTVLTPEGEFLRARNNSPHYQLGQEITFTSVTQKEKEKIAFLTFFRGRFVLPAAVALMFAFLFFIPFYQNNQVYAYLSIDINPSIELGINKKYEVIELKSYNDDGAKVIKQIQDWKHQEVDEVVEHLVGEIKKQGYMKSKQRIVVATVYAKEELPEEDKQLKQEMKEIKEVITAENLELTVVEGTQTEREKAITEGLTTGLYKEKKMKKQAAEKGNSVHVEEEMNRSVETVPSVQEEKTKNVKEKNPNIPPGQIKKAENQAKKEEKQKDKAKSPADIKQEEAVTVSPVQETSKNQKQNNNGAKKQEEKVQNSKNQEPKNWESPNQQNNNKEKKHDEQKNQNNRDNENNGNNGNRNNHPDEQTGPQGNNPNANNSNGIKKDDN